jgi:hypothetical protein
MEKFSENFLRILWNIHSNQNSFSKRKDYGFKMPSKIFCLNLRFL